MRGRKIFRSKTMVVIAEDCLIFRAYASKNPGVCGRPQGALLAQIEKTEIANLQFLRFSYCQELRPSLTPTKPSVEQER